MQDLLNWIGGLVAVAAYGGFWFAVFSKAGYRPRRLVLLMTMSMYVPLVNIGVAIYFVTTAWPIQDAMSRVRSSTAGGTADDAYGALKVATRLETHGNIDGAIAKYCEIVQEYPGSEAARDAEASIQNLRGRLGNP